MADQVKNIQAEATAKFDLCGSETLEGKEFVIIVADTDSVDMYSSYLLKDRLKEVIPAYKYVILDFTKVTYIDGCGNTVLIGAVREIRMFGGRIIVITNDPRVRKAFQITGMNRILEIHKTLDEFRIAECTISRGRDIGHD